MAASDDLDTVFKSGGGGKKKKKMGWNELKREGKEKKWKLL